ncbi:sensor histidine kinase [Cellulomonas oligotrophica]|uniref:histidine kinase n=1 Tax=Cellulomonas oligotrophica TaxID=931536 RepID=A0A7Y9K0H4_9CELL|nr:HAMP domain-containing sensor histidine kinase [Cellulomonas oligotrophica]NYD87290.1 two-component system OmpR family sensor kinase [Cellulomonas oligotrophica]GIG34208.1 two-component sensor histidine kinase [Cellulomonas oligotrophica]
MSTGPVPHVRGSRAGDARTWGRRTATDLPHDPQGPVQEQGPTWSGGAYDAPEDAPRPRGALAARWDAVPLRTRLVTVIVVLLGAGLTLAGATSATLLGDVLVRQVDDKLQEEGYEQVNAYLLEAQEGWGDYSKTPPSDYYAVVRSAGQQDTVLLGNEYTLAEYGTPAVPTLTMDEVLARDTVPYTIASDRHGSTWRAVTSPLRNKVTRELVPDTYVTVALPLRDNVQAIRGLALTLVSSGAALVLLGAIVGGWAVQRSLRPLREIEGTAAAIAAGDLSRRVPEAPEQTEVGRLGAALNGMLAQIEQAFDARTASEARMRRFVADASHELRTPLAAIRGYAELYRMGALTTKEQVDDTIRRIEGSATRMGSLVEDLLALARLDEGRRGERAPVDLTVLAVDALNDLHALDPARPLRLVRLDSGGPCVVHGDDRQLRQVLANLVGNASRHTPPGTPVEIAVGRVDGDDGPCGVLEVRDHGAGIDPEHVARVFERFYRVDASRTRDSGGSGLGMAIVAAIVDAHGGTVGIEQTPGGGATVRVLLPCDPAAPEDEGAADDGPDVEDATGDDGAA